LPWLRRLVDGILQRLGNFAARAVHVRPMVDLEALGHFSLEFFDFPRQFSLHMCSLFIWQPRDDHWEVRGHSSTKTVSPRSKTMEVVPRFK
jgi:hypothetical protein